ncbi:uncharacterized protein BXIN_2592 [Babesia sp. Xinjiang]|uniref:uncharacterized protein n=1 Tax=Babesia sp. Xinjiang TaxID=462227 RepID=UPI000A265F24|nr:uncharacterized protein BXIN_2592 [Babesia sp. Xinjiang]ORM40240.1 hypothetical protein BXIN_2592 [Babesia sp. Xinjiang]
MDTTAISTACLLEVLWDADFDVLDLPLSLEMVEAASDITEEMVEIVSVVFVTDWSLQRGTNAIEKRRR